MRSARHGCAHPRRRCAAALLAASLIALASAHLSPLQGQEKERQSLEQIEGELKAGREKQQELERREKEIAAELTSLRETSVTTARRAQEAEEALTNSETALVELHARLAAERRRLAEKRGQLGSTLAALQRLALVPPEALTMVPEQKPLDAVRSGLLLRVAVPRIESRADQLAKELARIESLRRDLERENRARAATAKALGEERAKLQGLIERQRQLQSETASARATTQSRTAKLAAEAKDLRELLKRLEEETLLRERAAVAARAEAQVRVARSLQPNEIPPEDGPKGSEQRAPETTQTASLNVPRIAATRPFNVRDFPSAPGRPALVLPARGRAVLRYGEHDSASDSASKGLTIATRAKAQVVAPYDGQVVYSGPFRSYGQILIIDHGGRYHSLLAGLERVDVFVGQWLLAGEPIGVMAEGSQQPLLYLELRRTGEPINPDPWLAYNEDKVRG